jgi:hypothetical protein
MKSTSEVIGDVLEHHGIKGMKWGVRRQNPSGVTVSDRRKRIKTRGGSGHPAHPDAIRARTTGQIARKSGYKAVSDSELRAYANRLQLEQQVKRLEVNERPIRKFITGILGSSGKNAVNQVANDNAAKLGQGAVRIATGKAA